MAVQTARPSQSSTSSSVCVIVHPSPSGRRSNPCQPRGPRWTSTRHANPSQSQVPPGVGFGLNNSEVPRRESNAIADEFVSSGGIDGLSHDPLRQSHVSPRVLFAA